MKNEMNRQLLQVHFLQNSIYKAGVNYLLLLDNRFDCSNVSSSIGKSFVENKIAFFFCNVFMPRPVRDNEKISFFPVKSSAVNDRITEHDKSMCAYVYGRSNGTLSEAFASMQQ
jgi:hypothetical protein